MNARPLSDLTVLTEIEDDPCDSCAEMMPVNECAKSERACGHHCNHSWSHDSCCWCGEEFGEEPAAVPVTEGAEAE